MLKCCVYNATNATFPEASSLLACSIFYCEMVLVELVTIKCGVLPQMNSAVGQFYRCANAYGLLFHMAMYRQQKRWQLPRNLEIVKIQDKKMA